MRKFLLLLLVLWVSGVALFMPTGKAQISSPYARYFFKTASDPAAPIEGQVWENTTTHLFKGYNGTSTLMFGLSVTLPSSIAQGDIPFGSATNVYSNLAKDTNATRYLSNTGTNNNPAWAQINAANGLTGTTPVANGGTGAATLTGILQGNGTSAVSAIALPADATKFLDGTGAFSTVTSAPFVDTTNIVKGSVDATKLLRFEVDGFTAGATRVITPPDANTSLWQSSFNHIVSGPTAARTFTFPDASTTLCGTNAICSGYEATANKDATGGYAGLTLFKINFKNAANTFTSFFTNSNSAARTYTFQNRDGTIADDTDLGLKLNLTGGTLTGDLSVSGASFGLTGNISGAGIFGTNGIRYKNVAGTLTDTTSSGTVATNYTNVYGANTLAASSATVITNDFNTYFKDPIAGTNVTLTNKWALGADSVKFGTSNQFSVGNTGHLTVEGVTSTGATGTGAVMFGTAPSVTTGINDANGNSMIAFTPTTSAVDWLTIANAATANPANVTLSATGSDTNISLYFKNKGSGSHFFQYTSSANDYFQINGSGTVQVQTNAGGMRAQIVVAGGTGTAVFRAPSDLCYGFNSGTNLSSGSIDTFICRNAAAGVQLGAPAAASPVAQTLSTQGSRSGTDTNIAGGNLTIQSGTGTGNSTGSSLIFNTPVAVASGTGAQTQTATLTLQGGNATFGGTVSATSFQSGGVTIYSAGTPSIAGNATLNTGSKDSAGKITSTGTGASTAVLTFSITFTRAPACFVTNETTSNLVRPISTTTTLTISATVVTGDSLSYTCTGY